MRSKLFVTSLGLFFCVALIATAVQGEDAKQAADKQEAKPQKWAFNASIIEACSCPMFCQCYFDSKPAAHAKDGHEGHAGMAGEHYCRFNNAFQVNKGTYGDTKLDGAKFWVGGDLGGDFSKGQMDWAQLTFDPSVTPEQREGIKAILGHVYPVKWGSFAVSEDKPIDWKAGKDKAVAKMDGGKAGELVLNRFPGNTNEPIVIHNLKYWGTPRNEGFILMPNEVEALRSVPADKKGFEYKGTNGFMITIDMNSKDVEKKS